MKMKKIVPFLLPILTLTSCGADKLYGTYGFQLGKDKSTHIGFSLLLEDKPYAEDEKEKKFVFTIDFKNTTPSETTKLLKEAAQDGTPEGQAAAGNLDINIMDLLADFEPQTGYYTIGGNSVNGRPLLNLNFEFLQAIEDLISSEIVLPSGAQSISDISNRFFFSEIDIGKAVYLNIPVSLNDLALQVYWYDYLETKDPTLPFEKIMGTHPTKEDIDEINKTFPDIYDGYMFRNYYTLSLGLNKR